jgi:hypothetical protein
MVLAALAACTSGAAPGSIQCAGALVDPSRDGSNCGVCGLVCQDERTCVLGECTCPVAECAGLCVDTQTDSANCGACGAACLSGVTCAAGVCQEDADWAGWPMPNPPGSGLPNPSTYDTSTPGVVVDKVTGLIWQHPIDATTYQWDDAKAHCAGLALAGGKWRLPTRIELVSLVDYTRQSPAIDVTAFPGTPSAGFWSSSPSTDSPNAAWGVDFTDGQSGGKVLKQSPVLVRCVR